MLCLLPTCELPSIGSAGEEVGVAAGLTLAVADAVYCFPLVACAARRAVAAAVAVAGEAPRADPALSAQLLLLLALLSWLRPAALRCAAAAAPGAPSDTDTVWFLEVRAVGGSLHMFTSGTTCSTSELVIGMSLNVLLAAMVL